MTRNEFQRQLGMSHLFRQTAFKYLIRQDALADRGLAGTYATGAPLRWASKPAALAAQRAPARAALGRFPSCVRQSQAAAAGRRGLPSGITPQAP
ncbi:protein of unknown function [Methylorubrum extorquens]|uniref:Uncharacterized protein n=1 Tax=Methylorubrum extorquens TaxID=408 RepID=A0A2N9AM39_METEX|nr:protein of unknown function [Methylorubrum extorquens]